MEADVSRVSVCKNKSSVKVSGSVKFSVIIPAYNAALYIKNSIDSILNQTFSDFEILVVDDGSIDDTEKIVNIIKDERIRYIRQSNGGVSSARNTGIRNARGEYVCFLDADDLWKPNHLEVVLNLINKYPGASVFLTGYEILLHDGKSVIRVWPGVENDLQIDNVFKYIFKYGYFISTNSISCKRDSFDVVGVFEVGVKNGEDDDMWYRLFAYYSAAVSSMVTTIYIRENSSATATRVFTNNWPFLGRVNTIMASSEVSEERKAYLKRLLEQRKLSFVRYCIVSGDKKTAWMHMRKIDTCLIKKRKYIETLVALIIPSAISNYFVSKRDKQYYGT